MGVGGVVVVLLFSVYVYISMLPAGNRNRCFTAYLVGRLSGWLSVGCLVAWLGWLTGWLVGWLACLAGWLLGWWGWLMGLVA